mmetsp:Transcript_64726/g.154584  ORF Transcript_64726/g.154584 Transcript_64726/m.154584 type:complete len:212 (-) Transcript_64726:64-699(-)
MASPYELRSLSITAAGDAPPSQSTSSTSTSTRDRVLHPFCRKPASCCIRCRSSALFWLTLPCECSASCLSLMRILPLSAQFGATALYQAAPSLCRCSARSIGTLEIGAGADKAGRPSRTSDGKSCNRRVCAESKLRFRLMFTVTSPLVGFDNVTLARLTERPIDSNVSKVGETSMDAANVIHVDVATKKDDKAKERMHWCILYPGGVWQSS